MSDALVGLDIGSTHAKAVLFSPNDRGVSRRASGGVGGGASRAEAAGSDGVRYVARRGTPTHGAPAGGAFHEPDELLAIVEELLAECAAAARDGGLAVRGIGIASMAEAGVPLDRRGRPLGEILAWFDPRPANLAASLRAELGEAAIFATTGLRTEAKCTLPKLLWWRHERPAAYRRLWRWAGVAELCAFHLTGELATNASLASRTLAYDVAARRWHEPLLELAGLTDERMPRVLPLGRPAGGLVAETARRVGLEAGIPVAVAGHDHVVAGLGAGVARPGDALDSMGTAEVALLVTPRPVLTDAVRTMGFSTGAHALDGAAYVLGGLPSAGAAIEWLLDRLLVGHSDASGSGSADRYGALAALLRDVPAPSRVLVQPYVRGRAAPHPDRDASLTLARVREEDGLGEIAGGLVDGVAFHVRWMLDELEAATGTSVRHLRVVGGGARNARWLAAKAALTPGLEVAATEEAAALGAALVGGVAAEVFESVDRALDYASPVRPFPSDAGLRRRYRRAFTDEWLPWVWPGAQRHDRKAPEE